MWTAYAMPEYSARMFGIPLFSMPLNQPMVSGCRLCLCSAIEPRLGLIIVSPLAQRVSDGLSQPCRPTCTGRRQHGTRDRPQAANRGVMTLNIIRCTLFEIPSPRAVHVLACFALILAHYNASDVRYGSLLRNFKGSIASNGSMHRCVE